MAPSDRTAGLLKIATRFASLLAFACALIAPAQAHRASIGRTDGLPIASLSHGQMGVIAHNRAAVVALATNAAPRDATLQRLLNYANIQRGFCLWGLVPGSITDETSPFNDCAHAYLAATKALLDSMREQPTADPAVVALAEKIDHELLLEGTLALCLYSGQPYNTADMIYPDWSAVPRHPPSALAAFGFLGAIAGAGSLLLRRRRGGVSAPG